MFIWRMSYAFTHSVFVGYSADFLSLLVLLFFLHRETVESKKSMLLYAILTFCGLVILVFFPSQTSILHVVVFLCWQCEKNSLSSGIMASLIFCIWEFFLVFLIRIFTKTEFRKFLLITFFFQKLFFLLLNSLKFLTN